MVVHVIYSKRERGGAGRNVVRLASSPAVTVAATTSGHRSLRRAAASPLRAASPPPPSASAVCWGEPAVSQPRRDVEEGWEEVAADAAGAEVEAREGKTPEEYGVVFGAPPSDDEVRAAVASIKQVFEHPSAVDSDGPDLQALALPIPGHPSSGIFMNHFALNSDASEVGLEEWLEPAMLVLNSRAFLTREHSNVLDAFRLLQEDSSVQKMVMALSTDRSVWNAVMNNEVVQEFKKTVQDAKETNLKASTTAPGVMSWILQNTQAKIKEFLEQILRVVNMLFQAGDKNYDLPDDVVRMSFMLSVFIFLVVTIARLR